MQAINTQPACHNSLPVYSHKTQGVAPINLSWCIMGVGRSRRTVNQYSSFSFPLSLSLSLQPLPDTFQMANLGIPAVLDVNSDSFTSLNEKVNYTVPYVVGVLACCWWVQRTERTSSSLRAQCRGTRFPLWCWRDSSSANTSPMLTWRVEMLRLWKPLPEFCTQTEHSEQPRSATSKPLSVGH